MIKAVVTGHSRGLGAAVAAELMARGIPVLGLARGHAEIGEGMEQAAVDLGDAQALGAWLQGHALRSFLAGCDTALLVNNAGVVTPVGPLAEQDPLAALRAATLNVGAPLALAAAFVQAAPQAERRILHVSSGAGRSAGQATRTAGRDTPLRLIQAGKSAPVADVQKRRRGRHLAMPPAVGHSGLVQARAPQQAVAVLATGFRRNFRIRQAPKVRPAPASSIICGGSGTE